MQQRPHPALKEGWWPFIIPAPWTSPSHGRGVTATGTVMKGGRGELCGREAALREPGVFDVQSPGPADCISGFSARAGSQPHYQEQTSR